MTALKRINERLDALEKKPTTISRRSKRNTYTNEMNQFLTEEYNSGKVWRLITEDFNILFETNKSAGTLRMHLLYINGVRY